MRTWLPESVGRAIMRTVLFETTVVSSPCWEVPHAAYHPPPLSRAQASELMNRPTPTVRANAIANGSRQTVLIDRFMLFLLCCACMKPEARARIHSTFLSTHARLSLMTTKRKKGRKFLRPFFFVRDRLNALSVLQPRLRHRRRREWHASRPAAEVERRDRRLLSNAGLIPVAHAVGENRLQPLQL